MVAAPSSPRVSVPVGSSESAARRRILRLLRWVPAYGVILAFALLALGSWSYVWSSDFSSYSVSPYVFRVQRDLIRPGMTRTQVAAIITKYDDHHSSGSSDSFGIMPKSGYPLRPYLYIWVAYDSKGRVIRTSYEDG